jgi:hypothetical protein
VLVQKRNFSIDDTEGFKESIAVIKGPVLSSKQRSAGGDDLAVVVYFFDEVLKFFC